MLTHQQGVHIVRYDVTTTQRHHRRKRPRTTLSAVDFYSDLYLLRSACTRPKLNSVILIDSVSIRSAECIVINFIACKITFHNYSDTSKHVTTYQF